MTPNKGQIAGKVFVPSQQSLGAYLCGKDAAFSTLENWTPMMKC